MKIGIFGGTFDPIHNGHIQMLDCFIKQISPDKTYVVPAHISPFKTDKHNEIADNQLRLAMIESAISDNPHIEICQFELEKKGVSFTIDTINYFASLHNNADIYLLIGTDQASSFDKWYKYEEILRKTNICIVKRPDYDEFEQKAIIDRIFVDNKPIWIEAPIIDITSTIIRKKIRNNESIEGLVPQPTLSIIEIEKSTWQISK